VYQQLSAAAAAVLPLLLLLLLLFQTACLYRHPATEKADG